MDDKRERIIKKIKKLFELASDRGATEGEAVAAALKAQKLIAEYDIDDLEIHASDAERIKEIDSEPAPRKWRWQLAEVVADNFRCRFLMKRHPNLARSRGTLLFDNMAVFYGYESDATAAAMTFNYLYKMGDRLASRRARQALKVRGSSCGVYNSYVSGFVRGVAWELEKQSEALMIVVPPKVNDSFEERTAGVEEVGAERLMLAATGDPDAYWDGFSNGKDAIRSRRLDGGGTASEPRKAPMLEA